MISLPMFPLLFAVIGLTAPWSNHMLEAHNAVRARVGVNPLEWSSPLAIKAQEWADILARSNLFLHSRTPGLGESMTVVYNGEYVPEQVVAGWVSESRYYDLRHNRCADVCGHYTQVVWRSTRQVGCAVSRVDNRQVWVCEYWPAGNFEGERPY